MKNTRQETAWITRTRERASVKNELERRRVRGGKRREKRYRLMKIWKARERHGG